MLAKARAGLARRAAVRTESRLMPTLILLTLSNLFMTTAWYWHLKGGMHKPILIVILISWGIAFFEYCLAVPANRVGFSSGWSPGQLKMAQEAISLIIFGGFMVHGEGIYGNGIAVGTCARNAATARCHQIDRLARHRYAGIGKA